MRATTYTATRLKAELLGVLDDVERTGNSVVVTKHGRPVARIMPAQDPVPLLGSVTFLVDDDGLVAPTEEKWDVEA